MPDALPTTPSDHEADIVCPPPSHHESDEGAPKRWSGLQPTGTAMHTIHEARPDYTTYTFSHPSVPYNGVRQPNGMVYAYGSMHTKGQLRYHASTRVPVIQWYATTMRGRCEWYNTNLHLDYHIQ